MGVEQGLKQFLQGSPAVSSIAATGGYSAQVPKNWPLPTWTYLTISNRGSYGLNTKPGLKRWNVQIDCYGAPLAQGADCVALANAISALLGGFAGAFPGGIQIDSAFEIGDSGHDFFDSIERTWRRMLEYEIFYKAT